MRISHNVFDHIYPLLPSLNLPKSTAYSPKNLCPFFFLCDNPPIPVCAPIYSWVCGHPLKNDLPIRGHTLLTLLSPEIINCQWFLRHGGLMSSTPIHVRILTGLIFCKSCVNKHSSCAFLITAALSCPEDTFHCGLPLPLALRIFIPLLPQRPLNLVWGSACYRCPSCS